MKSFDEEKRIQDLIKRIKTQSIATSNDEIKEAMRELFIDSRGKNAITNEELNTLTEGLNPIGSYPPDENMGRKYLDILAKLPEEEMSSFMLVSLICIFRLLHEHETGAELQKELFPLFKPQKFVELKKEFILNFGGLDRIEKDYKKLLTEKLTSGLTLQQHIDKVRHWFNSLSGEDLGNWIKLFAYVKAVKEFSENEKDIVNFREVSPGRYCFSIKQNQDFFSFFIRPDKKSGQFTTKAKNKFLKWLHDNQTTIEFPLIFNDKVWNIPMRVYEYAENVSDKEIFFIVDTNILESEFRDYVSIKIGEIDAIKEAWETIAENNPYFSRTKYSLNNFVDVPLKFLLTLKNIYSRKGNYKNIGFTGNVQRLSRESLDSHLGNLSDRLKKHLMNRDRLRTAGRSGQLLGVVENLIYETTFTIAKKQGWILSMPNYAENVYKFNINPGYFDRNHIAKRLKAPENP